LNKVLTSKTSYTDLIYGYYEAYLEINVLKEGDLFYIIVTGFAYNNAWGNGAGKMQKGGKGITWSQKALYKKVIKMVKNYQGQTEIFYLKQ